MLLLRKSMPCGFFRPTDRSSLLFVLLSSENHPYDSNSGRNAPCNDFLGSKEFSIASFQFRYTLIVDIQQFCHAYTLVVSFFQHSFHPRYPLGHFRDFFIELQHLVISHRYHPLTIRLTLPSMAFPLSSVSLTKQLVVVILLTTTFLSL